MHVRLLLTAELLRLSRCCAYCVALVLSDRISHLQAMHGARCMLPLELLKPLKSLRRCTCRRCAARWCAISLWPWCCWSFAPPVLMPTVVSCHVQATCTRRRMLLTACRVGTLLCSALRSCGACLLPSHLHRRCTAANALRCGQFRLLTP